METISERIKKGLEIRDLKQTDLVNLTGISKGALSSYISGTYEPKQRNIYKIAEALDVNEAWLMGYDVPMERNLPKKENSKTETSISIKEHKLLKSFNQLNETGKDEAIKRVYELTLIPSYKEDSQFEIDTIAAHNDHLDEEGEMENIMKDLEDMDNW